MGQGGQGLGRDGELMYCYCEERQQRSIQLSNCAALDCFAARAMTWVVVPGAVNSSLGPKRYEHC